MSAIGALGAGLMRYGELKDARRKEDLIERLEKEREAREEDRVVAKENRADKRERAKPAKTFIEKGPDGNYSMVYKNAYGDELKREAASPTDIEDFEFSKEEREASLEDKLMSSQYKGKLMDQIDANLEDAPLERQLKREEIRSRTNENDAQAEYYRNGGSRKGTSIDAAMGGDDAAGAEVLGKWADDRGKQMIKDGVMTKFEYDKWLQGVISTARQFGRDPREVFEEQARILSE